MVGYRSRYIQEQVHYKGYMLCNQRYRAKVHLKAQCTLSMYVNVSGAKKQTWARNAFCFACNQKTGRG